MGMPNSKSLYMASTLLSNQVYKARIGTITLDRDCLFWLKADPGIFQRWRSVPLSLAFKGGGGSTFGFQRGEGGSNIGFQRGNSLSFTLSPFLTREKRGDPTIALYFTFLENVLKIMNTKLIMILE
jgi:hypothetical protein